MGLLDYLYPSNNARSDETPGSVQTPSTAPLTNPKDISLPPSPATLSSEIAPSLPGNLSQKPARRFSFRPFAVQLHLEHKDTLSRAQEHEKKEQAAAALSKRLAKSISSSSDKRAKQSALLVRGLIIGPTASSPKLSSAVAKPQMSKLKTQLMQPESANNIIAHLRELSADTEEPKPTGPIHAVCLAHPDDEEHQLHFSKLSVTTPPSAASFAVMTAPAEALSSLFSEMHVIDLVKSPDFGLGQPGDGDGVLAGALPTAETVINGIEQITPQLMALGYATGRAIIPDHTGIHPPVDRISVLTYWWGLEVVLPPPSLAYLASAQSVSGSVINFLSALAVINNGVREILPFVRYISQYIDFEFKSIQAQNKGKGVVCAATWIMPAAMVPRPWDFTPPPPKPNAPAESKPEAPVNAPSVPHSSSPTTLTPASPPTQATPIALTPSIPAMLANNSSPETTHDKPPASPTANTPDVQPSTPSA
ncbi:hypothetical protein F5878DRAFT_654961 [Lentinula raphanica]|uniref:Uncharacterized protein n=1 Tax=Lentinula raphanica TaxID=153919 RepID=A0AA38PM18_9AGAR|nr:hypothetical protein F5878DRAFT_654961 [Lentinula raphanica]